MSIRSLCLVLAGSLACQLPVAGGAAPAIRDLGSLGGGDSRALGLNETGLVVGVSDTANGGMERAFVHGVGGYCRMTEIALGGYVSPGSANAVNDAGLVVGADNDVEDFYVYAYLWRDGAIRSLGIDGSGQVVCGQSSAALAVNGPGAVAGWRDVSTTSHEAFVYANGAMLGLGGLGDGWSEAYGINDAGQIVGAARTLGGSTRPFLYQAGAMAELPGLGGKNGAARAINAAGIAAGWADTAAGRSAVAWGPGGVNDLGHLGGHWSEAHGINAAGDIVGWSQLASGARRAFLYRAGTLRDLNEMLPPGSGWLLLEASDINDRGRIVGQGINPEGHRHAFLWSPDPLPDCPAEPAPAANLRPIARAGSDRTASLGALVVLDGTLSGDPDGGPDPLRFRWRTLAGPAATALAKLSTANPVFTPAAAGRYVFELVVSDGRDDSLPAQVAVQVEAPPGASGPAARAPAPPAGPVPAPAPGQAVAAGPVPSPPAVAEPAPVEPAEWAGVRPWAECATRKCLKALGRARNDLRKKALAALRSGSAASAGAGAAPAIAARKAAKAAKDRKAYDAAVAAVRGLHDR